MGDAPKETALAPAPADVVALVLAITGSAWPATDAALRQLHARIGLRVPAPTVPVEADPWPAAVDIERVELTLGDIFATSSRHRGEFLGLTLHLYSSMQPDNSLTRLGYDSILDLLVNHFGAATDAWTNEATPPRLWTVGTWQIALHFFHRRDSVVMLSVDDIRVSGRAELDADPRPAG